jgi:hypothetical protein
MGRKTPHPSIFVVDRRSCAIHWAFIAPSSLFQQAGRSSSALGKDAYTRRLFEPTFSIVPTRVLEQ